MSCGSGMPAVSWCWISNLLTLPLPIMSSGCAARASTCATVSARAAAFSSTAGCASRCCMTALRLPPLRFPGPGQATALHVWGLGQLPLLRLLFLLLTGTRISLCLRILSVWWRIAASRASSRAWIIFNNFSFSRARFCHFPHYVCGMTKIF